jgi:hypothetical protein
MTPPIDNDPFDSWISRAPRQEIVSEIEATRTRLEHLEASLAFIDNLADSTTRGESLNGTGKVPETKPEAIMIIVRGAPDPNRVAARLIYREMVEREWLPPTEPHRKRFYATLSRLAKPSDGRLRSVERGIYGLGPRAGGREA